MTSTAATVYAEGALLLARHGDIGWATLHRPAKKNALTLSILRDLPRLLYDAAGLGCACVVLAGAGDDAFSAGFDLDDLETTPQDEVRAVLAESYDAVERSPLPTIACISGWCIGAALELALACDLRVCSVSSTFLLPAGKLGLVYPEHGLVRISAAVGHANALRMVILSERFAAADALRLGLVHEISPDPAAAALAWGERIAASDTAAIGTMLDTLKQRRQATKE